MNILCLTPLHQDETVNDKSALLFDQVPATLFGCRASDIERYARIVFPLLFFTFHMVYWTILMSVSDITIEGLIPLKIKKDEHINKIIWKCIPYCVPTGD